MKYTEPTMKIEKFETENIIQASGIKLPVADVLSKDLTIDFQAQQEWNYFN